MANSMLLRGLHKAQGGAKCYAIRHGIPPAICHAKLPNVNAAVCQHCQGQRFHDGGATTDKEEVELTHAGSPWECLISVHLFLLNKVNFLLTTISLGIGGLHAVVILPNEHCLVVASSRYDVLVVC